MAENELQTFIKRIFNHIKEKYGYTDEQALIYLIGYRDCAEEHQQSLEKRDKMLRDPVAELCEAKRLLKSATDIIKDVDCNEDYLCDECEYRAKCDGGFSFYWRYADEVLKLI